MLLIICCVCCVRYGACRPPGATGDSSASCVDVSEEEDVVAVYNSCK